MAIGLLLLDCFMSESQSLKDKRRILSSLTERLRRQFNVAIAEVEHQDQWQRALLAIVFVNTNWRMLQSSMSKLTEYVDRDGRVEVTNTETRQLC
ncbi:MAG: DUF503 domain-containing protein [candidate division WOR-3 bacterium]|nr:DUF503 domain-containing protein [candidate division WOR-3 bacterium]